MNVVLIYFRFIVLFVILNANIFKLLLHETYILHTI